MSERNKSILTSANACVTRGDYAGFLAHCTEDTEWNFIGDRTLKGKEAVRQWMTATYIEPPTFDVTKMIAEGDFVAACGQISVKNADGTQTRSEYCDVWRFRDGKLAALNAYVVQPERK